MELFNKIKAMLPKQKPVLAAPMIWSERGRELSYFVGDYPREYIRAYTYTQSVPVGLELFPTLEAARGQELTLRAEGADWAGVFFGETRLGDAAGGPRLVGMVRDWIARGLPVYGLLRGYNSDNQFFTYELGFYKPADELEVCSCNLTNVQNCRENYLDVEVGSHFVARMIDPDENSVRAAYKFPCCDLMIGTIPANANFKLGNYMIVLGTVTAIEYSEGIVPKKTTVTLYGLN